MQTPKDANSKQTKFPLSSGKRVKEIGLSERDKKHLWHPLKQHQTHPNSLAIVKAKGCVLTDEDGNNYIDAISSWYTCMFGHSNPYILKKVNEQMQTLDQIMFSDFTS